MDRRGAARLRWRRCYPLRSHARREEGMFYPWADGHLPVEAATDVRERIGKSRHR